MKRNFTAVSFCQKYFLSFIFLLVPSVMLFAQEIVRGRVVDTASNQGLPGVSVQVKGTSRGTATNSNGIFSISASRGDVLVFSSASHEPQEVRVQNNLPLNISLSGKNAQLGEVVVIGYGTRQRKDVTGAISTVTAKDISKSTSMSPELALQGNAAGVFVNSGGGDPQARATVRIRGVNTFGYAEPLYVVDGIPIYEGGSGTTGGAIGDIRSPINILTQINPQDIESISVLKDASSAAIYGVRASNGVILITTKKGKTGRPKVEVSSSYGIQNVAKTYSVLNTPQYFALVREAYAANPNSNTTFEAQNGPLYDASNPRYAGNNPTYDWQRELLNKNAKLQEHNIRLSGGSEGMTYYLSTGFTKQESPLKANDLQRYNIATNIDAKVSKVISTGVTLRLVKEDALVNTGTSLTTMASTIPFQPIYDPNDPTGFQAVSTGSFVPNPNYDASKIDAGPLFNFAPGDPKLLWGTQSRENTFAFQQLNNTSYEIMKAMGNAYVQIEPLTGLRIKGSFGGDWYTNLRSTWTNLVDPWRFSQTPGNPYAGHNGQAEGRLGERRGTNSNIYKELTVNFNRTFFGDHNLDVILSASDQFAKWTWSDLSGYVNDLDPQYRGISNQPPFTQGSSSILQEDALLGYMGRFSYKYKDKYYVDGTLRYDGSSRLAPGYKWDYFPAFAVAWRITGEKFFPKVKFINDIKLRGGWGRLGNFQSAGYYKYLSGVNGSPDYPLGSGNGNGNGTQTQGVRLPDYANLTLGWEKLKTINAGFDAYLFNNKVSFTAEYYDKTTFDIIQAVSLPPNTGIQSQADLNIAQVRNSGIELQLGYNNSLGPVNFNVSGNFTTVKNRVVKLNGGTPLGGETGRIEEGYPMNYLWMYKVGGIFQTQAEIDAWRAKYADVSIGQSRTNATAGYQYKPGDMYFQDVYGNPRNGKERYSPLADSIINTSDRSYIGKTIPGYYYGFNFGANYKGIDVSLFFQGVGDVQKYNGTTNGLEGMGGLANQLTTVLDRWTPTNPSTTMPRAVFNNPSNPSRVSDRYVENAGYLRLKNVQIGYNVPRTLLSKSGFIQNIRVYASGVNLLTFTQWTGLDPENDGTPVTRQFLFGINATF